MSEIILITGAAGGIGQCLSQQLIQRDAELILADLDANRLAAQCAGLGVRARPFAIDITEEQQIDGLITFIRERFGRLDVLVNNAAIVRVGSFADRSTASIRRELDINLLAPLMLTHRCLDLLDHSRNARVVNTISIAGIFPTTESPIYSASKFGLRGAMLALAPELEQRGIQVSCIMPSATDTPMLRHEAVSGGSPLQFLDPPQTVETVVRHILQVLAKPKLETAPKRSELWLTRLLMLCPNLLPRLMPLLQSWGERGLKRYLSDLEKRGLAEQRNGKWRLIAETHE
ncbi:SDR family oxidoreductase [Aquipseudomonas alcaligenes]|uniref:Ketoreductase domain-containing protein n=1 Tax=Aquipseudomonas alcaligenes TaxID=43263 RepID=A0A1N6NPC3_AQUAC|nr:SDR family oxidoreductase [Pseudomonas alcaligenes]SIP93998.1 hypothetical protein SAMN05878282_101452 [Pseudomonas alcaligenes]